MKSAHTIPVPVSDLSVAVLGHERQALPVRVVVAVAALQPLLEQPAQQLLAEAAHRGPRVRVHLERVRDAERVRERAREHARPARRAAALLVHAAQLVTNGADFRASSHW